MFTSRNQAIKAVATLIVSKDATMLPVVNGLLSVFGYSTVEAPQGQGESPAKEAAATDPQPPRAIKLNSTNLASVSYQISRRFDARRPHLDRKPAILTVTFHNGSVYEYVGVQERIYNDLLNAPSAGEFFNENIRDEYTYKKVKASNASARSA